MSLSLFRASGLTLVCLLLAGMLALAACSSADDDEDAAEPAATTAPAAQAQPTAAPPPTQAPPADAPQTGGTLRFGIPEPNSFDPQATWSVVAGNIAGMYGDVLVSRHPRNLRVPARRAGELLGRLRRYAHLDVQPERGHHLSRRHGVRRRSHGSLVPARRRRGLGAEDLPAAGSRHLRAGRPDVRHQVAQDIRPHAGSHLLAGVVHRDRRASFARWWAKRTTARNPSARARSCSKNGCAATTPRSPATPTTTGGRGSTRTRARPTWTASTSSSSRKRPC